MQKKSRYYSKSKTDELLNWFPPGLFDNFTSEGSKKAYNAFKIIEEIIKEDSYSNFLLYRSILLQEFSDIENNEYNDNINRHITSHSTHKLLLSLFPDSYHWLIKQLNNEQAEIFLKFFIKSHEFIGKLEGTKIIIQAMLELAVQKSVNVKVLLPEKQDRVIANEIRSLLGKKYSTIGSDFVPGKRYYARPLYYEIHIGPIDIKTLEKFQSHNWADDRYPSEMLKTLAHLTEPYYIASKIKFIIATLGFTLGKSQIGNSKLGNTEVF